MNKTLSLSNNILGQRGSAMVEIALSLPVFLFGLLFFIWLGIIWNARSSLTNAVGNALRLASTRGDVDKVGSYLIEDIARWQEGGAPSQTLEALLASSDQQGNYLNYYNNISAQVFGMDLRDLPAQYIYALVYLNTEMKMSIGSGLRYPCDPYGEDENKGENCLSCKFLNPDSLDSTTYTDEPPSNLLAIQCSYQPQVIVLNGLLRTASAVTQGSIDNRIVLQRTKTFAAP